MSSSSSSSAAAGAARGQPPGGAWLRAPDSPRAWAAVQRELRGRAARRRRLPCTACAPRLLPILAPTRPACTGIAAHTNTVKRLRDPPPPSLPPRPSTLTAHKLRGHSGSRGHGPFQHGLLGGVERRGPAARRDDGRGCRPGRVLRRRAIVVPPAVGARHLLPVGAGDVLCGRIGRCSASVSGSVWGGITAPRPTPVQLGFARPMQWPPCVQEASRGRARPAAAVCIDTKPRTSRHGGGLLGVGGCSGVGPAIGGGTGIGGLPRQGVVVVRHARGRGMGSPRCIFRPLPFLRRQHDRAP